LSYLSSLVVNLAPKVVDPRSKFSTFSAEAFCQACNNLFYKKDKLPGLVLTLLSGKYSTLIKCLTKFDGLPDDESAPGFIFLS